MVTPRHYHTATLLADGRVLIVGGVAEDAAGGVGPTTAVELYDPASGSWAATSDLPEPRWYHTATLLDDGSVLVAGGSAGLIDPLAMTTAYLYDPADGIWTSTGDLATPRQGHTATLLPDGRVLVAAGGGSHGTPSPTFAEIFDPADGTWAETGDMNATRTEHSATLLPDGTVLLVGGRGDAGRALDPETFDPASGQWATVAHLITPRDGHVALFTDGTVFVIGGTDAASKPLAATERFDPGGGTWTATAALSEPRDDHTATLLSDGTVLVTGGRSGEDDSTGLASAERYDKTTGSWTATTEMPGWRSVHTATLLPDGTVLVAGGSGEDGIVAEAALFDLGAEP